MYFFLYFLFFSFITNELQPGHVIDICLRTGANMACDLRGFIITFATYVFLCPPLEEWVINGRMQSLVINNTCEALVRVSIWQGNCLGFNSISKC